MTILTKALSAIGLMRVSEHERLTRLKTAALDTIAQSYCGEVKAATDWEAKFKKAVADLAAETEMVRELTDKNVGLVSKLQTADGHVRNLSARLHYAEPRAQKWDASLKRSRDRKEAKKNATPPARDKRAKNRGGSRG